MFKKILLFISFVLFTPTSHAMEEAIVINPATSDDLPAFLLIESFHQERIYSLNNSYIKTSNDLNAQSHPILERGLKRLQAGSLGIYKISVENAVVGFAWAEYCPVDYNTKEYPKIATLFDGNGLTRTEAGKKFLSGGCHLKNKKDEGLIQWNFYFKKTSQDVMNTTVDHFVNSVTKTAQEKNIRAFVSGTDSGSQEDLEKATKNPRVKLKGVSVWTSSCDTQLCTALDNSQMITNKYPYSEFYPKGNPLLIYFQLSLFSDNMN